MGRDKSGWAFLIAQGLLVILFCIFGRYERNSDLAKYALFQDVHVMIFVGFGYLMTFLKRYSFSSLGFTFLLGSFIIQWAMLCQGFYQLDGDYKMQLGIQSMYRAETALASVLISMGAVLGRTSISQLIIMGFIEILVYSANFYVGLEIFKINDVGGSILIHVFGAYFGLAVSFAFNRKKEGNSARESGPTSTSPQSNYTSDLFAMIGTIFLWIYWPSFNAIEVTGEEQLRAIVNTYLSLAASCVVSFAVSSILTPEHKFDMVHVQNSTLAGGVAVGASANVMLQPYGAVIVGSAAGYLSVVGFVKLSPLMEKALGIPDTCGIHNLHGMPGVLAGLVSAFLAAIATEPTYEGELDVIFHERRGPGGEAGYQLLGLMTTLGIALASGFITGTILRWMPCTHLSREFFYGDTHHWIVPEVEPLDRKASAKSHYDNLAFEMPISPVQG